MSVDGTTNGGFATSTPHLVFEAPEMGHGGYAVTPDGHFLWAKSSVAAAKMNLLRVIENFDTEVARHAVTQQP